MPIPMKESLRRICVAFAAALLRASSRPYISPAGGALIVAPHADDETLGCGGFIAAQSAADRQVDVVFLTDSAGSHPGHPRLSRAALAEMRRSEACAALAVLGVGLERTHFLDLPDGGLDRLAPEAIRLATDRLEQLMRRLRPAEVFAPYLLGGSTEHAAANRLASCALAASGGGLLMEYPIWAWWNPFRLRSRFGRRSSNFQLRLGPWLAVKLAALACHRSQVAPIPPAHEPALPVSLARACCGPREFFFASRIPAG
jgi:LmbE family N-acetylglucosaminyl deacetylase